MILFYMQLIQDDSGTCIARTFDDLRHAVWVLFTVAEIWHFSIVLVCNIYTVPFLPQKCWLHWGCHFGERIVHPECHRLRNAEPGWACPCWHANCGVAPGIVLYFGVGVEAYCSPVVLLLEFGNGMELVWLLLGPVFDHREPLGFWCFWHIRSRSCQIWC